MLLQSVAAHRVLQLNNSFIRESVSSRPFKIQTLHFSGETFKQAGKNGLWVSVELSPYAIVGGLGQVSETIPQALNEYLHKDVRVLVPLLYGMKSVGFEKTGLSVKLLGPDHEIETFELMQKAEPNHPTIYAIANEKYFGKHKNIYFPKTQRHPDLGGDAMFKAVALFNRAAAKFIPYLEGSLPLPAHSSLKVFDGNLEFLMVHDWLTSPLLNELPEPLQEKLGKVLMLHNTYNESRAWEYACGTNHLQSYPLRTSAEYSPLAIGIKESDIILADRNYAKRVAHEICGDADFSIALREKLKQHKVFNVHHGLAKTYNPTRNPHLKTGGFVELDSVVESSGFDKNRVTEAALNTFKETNKQALQNMLGLSSNPAAMIFSWVARPDPYQKGFYLLMDEAQRFLLKYPQAQMIVAGPVLENAPPVVVRFMTALKNDPRLRDRIVFPGFVNNETVAKINAGSDFLMLPSLFEPFGLSQLEAMKMGNLPIVHGVDGLRSTVSDPWVNRLNPFPVETAWSFGQTGLMMKPIDVMNYWKVLDKIARQEPLERSDLKVLQKARDSFRNAMERAVNLAGQPRRLTRARINGMHYVEKNHRWEVIAKRFEEPIQKAVECSRTRSQRPLLQFC